MRTITIICIAATMVLSAQVAFADETDQAAADKAVFKKLVREVRAAHVKLAQAYEKATVEARTNGGKASTQTEADILSLRDEIDRKSVRLMLVALRHGWEVPDFAEEARKAVTSGETAPKPRKTAKEIVFGSVRADIRERVNRANAADAMRIAAQVHLPVISCDKVK